MTSGRDDDALTWSGDDDPTLDVGSPAPAPAQRRPASGPAKRRPATEPASASLPNGFTAVGRGSDQMGRADAGDAASVDPAERAPMGNGTLIGLGVFGGVYLLYAIGWIIGGTRLWVFAVSAVPAPFFSVSLGFAVAAPVLWFATAYLLTRAARVWVWMLWLVAGAVLLVPWPLLMVGTVGQ